MIPIVRQAKIAAAVIAATLAIWSAAGPARAMTVSITDAGMPLQVKLEGEIAPGDANRIIGELQKAKPRRLIQSLAEKAPSSSFDPRQWLWVEVESSGGDLEESMKLGRYLRSANALITTRQICTSACVFLLAGAVERIDLAEAAGRIGIHRPYFTDARNHSEADLSEYFTTLHKELLSYLEEMHVGTFLANMMFAVPPEQMKFLTAEQIAEAFPQKDPAWDEVTVARRASLYGMNSLTYRAQWVQQLSECSSRALIQATSLDHADCLPSQAAAKSPIFIDEFAAPPLLFSGQCSQMPDLSVHRSGNGDFLTCVSAMTLRRVAFSPLFEAKIAD